MTTPPTLPRSVRLKEWMSAHGIIHQDVAEQLGITKNAVQTYFNGDCMPVRYHEKCVALGFPVELLPMPYDRPRGRTRRKPFFPGLATAPNDAHA